MGSQWGPTDNRGISDIYGTVLIISLVFVTAVALVGVGFFVLDDTAGNANDRLAQDSVLELDDRLTDLTDDQVENSITWEVPQGTAEDFDADGDRGTINVTARTNDTYWDASRGSPGGLVDADSQTNSAEVSLGTITHESDDGVLTVYQGGGVLEVQDGTVTVLREPDISVSDGNLVLDFVNISSVEQIDDSELTATQQQEEVDSEKVQKLIDQAMRRDGDVVAPAEINITVTSRFAEGWGKLIEESVEDREIEIWESDDLAALDENQVRISFNEFGEGIDLPSKSSPYGSGVIYSGIADLAPELYDDTIGNVSEDGDGFEVDEPTSSDDYTVGLRYDDGTGPNWWEYDSDVDRWVNIEDPTASDLAPTAPDPVSGVAGDSFEIDDGAWTCVVRDDDLRDHVDSAGDGCFVEPVSVDSPDDSVAEFEPLLEITDLDVSGPGSNQLEFGTDQLQVDVTVENTGTADADSGEPVAMLVDPQSGDPWVGNGTRLTGGDSLARGSSTEYSLTYTPRFIGEKFQVQAGTPDDAALDPTIWEVTKTPDAEEFEIEDVDVLNSPVVAGDSLEVDVTVNNTGDSGDRQDVILANSEGPQAAKTFDLDPSDPPTTRTIEWETEIRDGTPGLTTINISTLTDQKLGIPVNIQPPGSAFANFQIQRVDIDDPVDEGDDLKAEVEIKNEGSNEGTRTIRLRDGSGVIRATVNDLTLSDGETVTLGTSGPPLVWETETGDAGVYNLTVETDDDTNTTTGVEVNTPTGVGTFNVSIREGELDDVIAGDDLEVPVDIEYNGGGSRTESIWLGNFDGEPVDAETVSLTSGSSVQRTLVWETEGGDGQDDPGTITANGVGDIDSASVEVRPKEEGGPNLGIASVSTNSSTADDGSLPSNPTVEGDDLEIDVELENTGGLPGTGNLVVEYAPEDQAVATTEIDVDDGETESVTLTWQTVIGDNTTTEADPTNAEDIVVKIDGDTATEEVFIDERTRERDPVDVMFAIDESGSMGTINNDDWMEATPRDIVGGGDYEVGSDIEFDEPVTSEGEEFWYAFAKYGRGEVLVENGEVVSVGDDTTAEIWPGKKLTSEVAVSDGADMWYALPETDGSLSGTVEGNFGSPDGDFYVSGQTVDPADHGGEAYVLNLTSDTCGGLCFDSTGNRYDAVQTAVSSLDESVDDRAGLMSFANYQNVYQPIVSDLDALNESLRVNPGGGTDITSALIQSENQLDDLDDPNKKTIVLLTDGEHTAGTESPDEYADEIGDDITVYVVGFGNADTSEDGELAPVANAGTGDGSLYDGDEDSLEDIFGEIGEELNEPDLPSVEVSTNDSFTVKEDETLDVPVGVENTGEAGERIITLSDIYGNVVDSTTVSLTAGQSIDASDSDAPVLEWDAELQGDDDPPTSGELLVRTPSSEATPDVTVNEGDPSNFVVDIQNVDPGDPQATDDIEVTVDIENQQPGADTQTVILRDDDGTPVDVQTVTLGGVGGSNDETTETFVWQTRSTDSGDGQMITVESEDSADSSTIDIDDPPGTNDEFEVNITGANDPVSAGEELDVDVRVENVGSDSGQQFVELRDFANRTVDLVETSELSDGTSETHTLTWNTTAGDGDTEDLYVASQDDVDGQEVEIQPATGSDSEFEITSATTVTDPINASDTIEVQAAIENTGTDADSQYVEAEFNGVTKTKERTLDPSDPPAIVNFTFSTARDVVDSTKTFDIELGTDDDSETTPVTIKPTGDPLSVDIVSTGDSVEAGKDLTVKVDVKGLNSESALSLETPYGSSLNPADVESTPSDGTYNLTWSTRVGQGSSDPQEIIARVQGTTDTADVTVEEAPEGAVVAPGTGPSSDPVGIEIDEVEIE